MPFLIGVHSSMMEQVRRMPVNDVVILDIDNDEIESPYYEDLLQLPVDTVSLYKIYKCVLLCLSGQTHWLAFWTSMKTKIAYS